MLSHLLSIKRFSIGTPPLQMDHRLLPAIPRGGIYVTGHYALSVKIPPGFSSISATCIWQPTAGRGQPWHQAGCSQGCIRRSRLFPVPSGSPKGLLWGLSLCYFFGQAEQETSAALCCSWDRSAAGRGSPRMKWGWRCSSCTSIPVGLNESLKLLSQPPTMSNLAGLISGGVGMPQDQRQTGTVGPVPWLLLHQHGCLLFLVRLKRTVRSKPWFFLQHDKMQMFAWSTSKYPERISFCQISNSIFVLHVTILYTFV